MAGVLFCISAVFFVIGIFLINKHHIFPPKLVEEVEPTTLTDSRKACAECPDPDTCPKYCVVPEDEPYIKFMDAWGCRHSLTQVGASEMLKEYYDAWPGGLEEIEASIKAVQKTSTHEILTTLKAIESQLREMRADGIPVEKWDSSQT